MHEIAQAIAPQSRVAYVDNDMVVLAHARALMTSTAEGRVGCAQWDLRYDDPGELLAGLAVRNTLDFGEPIAVLIVGVLPFILDKDAPTKAIQVLVDALPPGSHVAASHVAMEHDLVGTINLVAAYDEGGIPVQLRDAGEFRRLAFPGLEMVSPGVVPVSQWRPAFGTPLVGGGDVLLRRGRAEGVIPSRAYDPFATPKRQLTGRCPRPRVLAHRWCSRRRAYRLARNCSNAVFISCGRSCWIQCPQPSSTRVRVRLGRNLCSPPTCSHVPGKW